MHINRSKLMWSTQPVFIVRALPSCPKYYRCYTILSCWSRLGLPKLAEEGQEMGKGLQRLECQRERMIMYVAPVDLDLLRNDLAKIILARPDQRWTLHNNPCCQLRCGRVGGAGVRANSVSCPFVVLGNFLRHSPRFS